MMGSGDGGREEERKREERKEEEVKTSKTRDGVALWRVTCGSND